MKWFRRGERHESEALELRERIERRKVEVAANEVVSLEVVRGLKNAQTRQPALLISDDEVEAGFATMEAMFRTGVLVECPVAEVKTIAKDVEMSLGLFMADALHLATAIHLRAEFFVVDDQHFLSPAVVNYTASMGVQIVNLPELIARLHAAVPNGG